MPDNNPQKPVDLEPPVTGIVHGLDSYEPHSIEPPPPDYVKEPLFNKKVMVVWALAAFALWFAVKMVVPAVLQSVKTAVVESVKEAEQKSGGKVTIRRNGGVIEITTKDEPAPAGTAVPAPTATPAAPAGTAPAAKVVTPAPPAVKK